MRITHSTAERLRTIAVLTDWIRGDRPLPEGTTVDGCRADRDQVIEALDPQVRRRAPLWDGSRDIHDWLSAHWVEDEDGN